MRQESCTQHNELYCHRCRRQQLDLRDMSESSRHLCVACDAADIRLEQDRMRMGM